MTTTASGGPDSACIALPAVPAFVPAHIFWGESAPSAGNTEPPGEIAGIPTGSLGDENLPFGEYSVDANPRIGFRTARLANIHFVNRAGV